MPDLPNLSTVVLDDHTGRLRQCAAPAGAGLHADGSFPVPAATQHLPQPAPRLPRRPAGGGLPYDPALVCTLPVPTQAAGAAAMRHLLTLAQPPDAVFSSYDLPVIGALDVLQAQQIRVPQQVALAGFSNEPFTTLVRPQLTSVEQRGEQMGEAAVRLLLQMLNRTDGFRPQRILINPQLLVHDSSRRG